MKYKLKDMQIDLGTTPFENIFLNNYLAIASGDFIKVYLYGYKKAYEGSDENESFKEIADQLNLTEETVGDAFGYWQEQGIVDIVSEGQDFSCEFKSLRQLFLGISLPGDKAGEKEPEPRLQDPKAKQDPGMTNNEMYKEIEAILGTSLLPSEIERIHKLREEFNQDRELIVHGFVYSSDTQGKKNINYVLTVLRNWAIDGILTMEDLTLKTSKEEKTKESRLRAKKVTRTKDKKSSEDIQEALKRKLMEDYKKAQGEGND